MSRLARHELDHRVDIHGEADVGGARVALDGRNLLPLMKDPSQASPHEHLYFFADEEIVALRSGRWHLVTHAWYRNVLGVMENFDTLPGFDHEYQLLFDTTQDLGLHYSVADRHPAVVARLESSLAAARAAFEPLRTHAPRPVYPPADP